MSTGACRTRSRGFTFVELMMTLAILGVLASVAIPFAQLSAQRDKERALRQALGDIRGAIDAYKKAVDDGRVLANVGQSGYPPSLESLVEGVPDQRSPARAKIYFLRSLPQDPMHAGSATGATWGLRSYASEPSDPAEGVDVFDVYSRSEKVGLNGVPYRQW